MSVSDSCTENTLSQKSGLSADSPISIASPPASSVSSCDAFADQGVDELEVNPGLDTNFKATAPDSSSSNVVGDTATIPSADDEARLRALMAEYERVMSGESEQSQCFSSDIQTIQEDDGAILPDCHGRDDRSVDKPTKTDAPQGDTTRRRTRRRKENQPPRAQSRVQKKSASVRIRQAYTFLRLGGARRAASGAIECEVYWAPTWLPIDHLEGNKAIQEAKDLVVELFGPDTWHEEARKLGLIL